MHPADRGAAMVFQSYALYPHMTVAENMGFALKMAGVAKASRDEQVARAAQVLKISDLLARLPKELSGGQRQRVAIGRAIVRDPKVFLFDEPLSNLDASLRVSMRIELSRLHKELGRTMIYVTHDQVEAMTLGDRIAIFNQGVIEQVGSPMELYQRPANEFVAGFLGTPKINMIDRPPANASGTYAQLWNGLVPSSKNTVQRAGVRPENLRVVSADEGIAAQVELLEHLGDASILYLQVEGLGQLLAAKVSGEPAQLSLGQAVGLKLEERHALHFDQAGRLLS
jgi:multiple sugar transport system ATP-binding protein